MFDVENNENKYNKLISYLNHNCELTEKDFYPPQDTRLYNSYVEDIVDGDNFADYVKYFLKQYENELFDN